MKVVVVHNFYQQAGGEDQVFADETALLESHGHQVIRHTVHNNSIKQTSAITVAGRTIWNRSAHAELFNLVQRERADVVHFHNTFPILSPAVYDAARSAGAAVVQTLHNYRLMCPAAIFYRDGHVCEDCQGKAVPWPAVLHKCYRGSLPASAVSATMLTVHRARGTYRHDVDAYIALTEFARGKFVAAGLPAEKIFIKPNFVSPDPGVGTGAGGYAVFVGRLSHSKGLTTLLDAWKKLSNPIKLKILGDGEMAQAVREASATDPRIEWLGRRPLDEVYHRMGAAAALVFPSVWYEGLPKTIIESFAKGTPVIASRLGSMAELVTDDRTGKLFAPGDPADLASTVSKLFDSGPTLSEMRSAARSEYESKYTPGQNFQELLGIYDKALLSWHRTSASSVEPRLADVHEFKHPRDTGSTDAANSPSNIHVTAATKTV
jgi:glycosyltransferase involved in cell wall biosynthesis